MLFSFHSYLYRMRFQFEWLALYSPKKDAKRLQYRMNSNRGIFFRFATSGSESVFARKRLEILSIPFDELFDERTVRRLFVWFPKQREKSGGKASRIFRNEWRRLRRRFYRNTCIFASRLLDAITSPEACFGFHPASRVNSIFVEKNKALGVASFSRHRCVCKVGRFARASERALGNLGSPRSITQGQSALLMRGTRWRAIRLHLHTTEETTLLATVGSPLRTARELFPERWRMPRQDFSIEEMKDQGRDGLHSEIFDKKLCIIYLNIIGVYRNLFEIQ